MQRKDDEKESNSQIELDSFYMIMPLSKFFSKEKIQISFFRYNP